MEHKYKIKGMHCDSCIEKITNSLKPMEGISSVKVTLEPPEAVIEMSHHVDTALLNKKVKEAGNYSLEEQIENPDLSKERIEAQSETEKTSLLPLYLIVAYILGVVLLVNITNTSVTWMDSMRHFMAGFFLVFSFFKFLDLKGFASAFRGYDIIAKRSEAWAYVYPFVELFLGVLYLLNISPTVLNLMTLILMLIGSIGVLKALLDKQAIQCACLGAVLNLPMTKITLVENLGMALMAIVMLLKTP